MGDKAPLDNMGEMNDHYRLYRRSNGVYYLEHAKTRRQESLHTKCPDQARSLLLARNQAIEQPALNAALAKAYLSGRAPKLMRGLGMM